MKQEILLILCLPILLVCVDVWKIKLIDSKLGNKLCGAWESVESGTDTINTHFIRKCADGEICQGYDSDGAQCDESLARNRKFCMGFCEKRSIQKLAFPGASCKYDFECYGGLCENEKCKAITKGGDCKGHEKACDKGLSCQMKGTAYSCETMLTKGQVCNNDNECEMKYDCYEGACTEPFSLEIGEKSSNELYCKTGEYYESACSFIKEVAPCEESDSDPQFKYQCPITYQEGPAKRICIDNYDGKKACSAHKSDEPWFTEYVEQRRKVYSELKSDEMYSFERDLIYNKDLAYFKARYENFSLLKGAPDNLVKAFTQNNPDKQNSLGNGSFLNISLISLIIYVISLV